MTDKTPPMKPIWFFVGLILLAMGGVILLAGLYGLFFRPLGPAKVLSRLHPDIWWGGFMIVCGLLFLLFRRREPVSRPKSPAE